MSTKHFGEI